MGHVPHLHLPGRWEDPILSLSAEQSHHIQRVLRLRNGAEVTYTDGAGRVGAGTVSPQGVVRGEESTRKRPSEVTVAVAPPRSRERTRFLVEKLAEVGVWRLVWIRTHRTEGRPPRADKAVAWASAALEQSRGAWAMEISEASFDQLGRDGVVVLDPLGDDRFPAGSRTLLVGPEGGFGEDEVGGDLPRVSLGPTVLRVETAALVGAALLRSESG